MEELARRIRRLLFALALLLALPLPSAASNADAAADNPGSPRLLVTGAATSGGWFSTDGSHVVVRGVDEMLSFPVAGGDPVSLGAGFVRAPMNDPALILATASNSQGEIEVHVVNISNGERRMLAADVSTQSLRITDDDRWVVADVGGAPAKIDVATGDVTALPTFLGDTNTSRNEFLYLVPTGGADYEVRGLHLDTAVDRLIGTHTSADPPFISVVVYGELDMVDIVESFGGRSSEDHSFYTFEPWYFLHLARPAPEGAMLSSDGKTVYSLGGPCCGSWEASADKIDGSGLVKFGGGDANEYSRLNATTPRLGLSGDDRYASSFVWWFDQRGLPGVPTAYVYDVLAHTASPLGEGTATAVTNLSFSPGQYDDFFGSEPRLLIETIGAHGGPTEMFSVNVTGGDARPWPLYVTIAESRVAAFSVGDDVYALGDAGLYRLKPDGSAPRLVSKPSVVTAMSLSPTEDYLTYVVDNLDGTYGVWLLSLDHSGGHCDGPNVIRGTAGPDVLIGTAGNDVIVGGGGDDRIEGRGGDDRICGGTGNDDLRGGGGDDIVLGQSGNDEMRGGPGRDVIYGASGRDVVDAGPGWDAVYGGSGADTLRGGPGRDWLHGDKGADKLYGEGDGDTIYAGYGDDTLRGGAGRDHLVAALGTNEVFGGRGGDVIHLRASSGLVHGGGGPDQIYWRGIGEAAVPSIWAGAGDDLIGYENHRGECGIVHGGAGDDTIRCGGWVAWEDRDAYTGRAVLKGGAGNDSITGFWGHDLLRGGLGDDSLAASLGDDHLHGGGGDDILLGQDGDDHLFGGPGTDQLLGGNGNDVCQDDGAPPVAC